jgi:hemolysin activation/secretion protein
VSLLTYNRAVRRSCAAVVETFGLVCSLLNCGSLCALTDNAPLPPLDGLISPAINERVTITKFTFIGNTVFTDDELEVLLENFTARDLGIVDLEQARQIITAHYVKHGYITSGALLEDQTVANGELTFRVIEGQLDTIEVTGNRRLTSNFIRARLGRTAIQPVHLPTLQSALLQLKSNPSIAIINAELAPGLERGFSNLRVRLQEANPWTVLFQARNDRPPAVGSDIFEIVAGHNNLTGHSDALQLRYGFADIAHGTLQWSAFDNWGAAYRVPVNAADSSIELHYDESNYAVVEEPFAQLDIQSRSEVQHFGWRQPIRRSSMREFTATVAAERRHSESTLDGVPFSFSAGAAKGESTSTALRLSLEWLNRSPNHVLAVRSTINWGVDLLDSTDNGTDQDGQFVSWLNQAQYLRRLGDSPAELSTTLSSQWAGGPLLSVEQFTIGGAHTVRGYRENQLVRDSGIVASIELRWPLLMRRSGKPMLQLAPFADFGAGWNGSNPASALETLSSTGVGLIFEPNSRVHAQVYWGHAFQHVPHPGGTDAQDYGIHFKLSVVAF